jgi:hypothetical protein
MGASIGSTKCFGGELESVLAGINEAMWKKTA